MQYIVLDMEWNQPWPGSYAAQKVLPVQIHGEIIQIGAVRLLETGKIADEFHSGDYLPSNRLSRNQCPDLPTHLFRILGIRRLHFAVIRDFVLRISRLRIVAINFSNCGICPMFANSSNRQRT